MASETKHEISVASKPRGEVADISKISANLKDGILEVALPKEESVQRRSVEVK